jgi:two-component system response regulator (stage 0 sporulation protein F)
MNNHDIKILIVDDEEDFREIFSILISRLGYKPYTAANGMEALDLMKTIAPDIAIIDYQIPRMNGIELMKAIKKHNDSIEILLITGYDLASSAAEPLVCNYVTKPLDLDHIERQLRHLIAKRRREGGILSV